MKSKAQVREAAGVFAALGDETRLQLLTLLSEQGPSSITRLTAGQGMSRQAVTKHLVSLKRVGLVHEEASGREKLWDLDKRRVEIAERFLRQVSGQWDLRLRALKDLVEK